MLDRNFKILIADDEPMMRNLLTSYLHQLGNHEVIKVADGAEALKYFHHAASDFDIVFLDIEMPRVDGIKVLEEIRSTKPEAYVVILSGAGSMQNVRAAIDAGVNGFIAKPYTNKKIEESVNNYIKSLEVQV